MLAGIFIPVVWPSCHWYMKSSDLMMLTFIPIAMVFIRMLLSFIQISESVVMSPCGPPTICTLDFQ